jgi:DNA-binding transcriptional LysR family regulator
MELSQLEYFVVLAEHLHYRHAALAAGTSPSTLSRQIADLEADLDTRLFERNRRQVRLTPAGEAFLLDARATLHRLRFAAVEARRIGRGDQGRLRVGHGDAVAVHILQVALPALRLAHPGMRLQVVEAPSTRLIDELGSGRIDLALVRPPVHRPGLEDEWLCDEAFVVVVPAGHRLAGRRRLRVADLGGEALIVPERESNPGAYDAVMAVFTAARVPVDVAEESTTSLSTLLMVGAGLGVALVAESATVHADVDGLVVVPLAGSPTIGLHAAWRAGEQEVGVRDLRLAVLDAVAAVAAATPAVRAATVAAVCRGRTGRTGTGGGD